MDDRAPDPTTLLRGWADRLQASARTGLFFANNEYDRERYEQIIEIAAEMAGLATGQAPVEIRATWAQDVGYVTPRVGVGAAIFDERGRLLLQKRTDSGLWALPGRLVRGRRDAGGRDRAGGPRGDRADRPAGAIDRRLRLPTRAVAAPPPLQPGVLVQRAGRCAGPNRRGSDLRILLAGRPARSCSRTTPAPSWMRSWRSRAARRQRRSTRRRRTLGGGAHERIGRRGERSAWTARSPS